MMEDGWDGSVCRLSVKRVGLYDEKTVKLSGHICIRLLNLRNTKSGVQYCTVQNGKFSATARTCSVTDYGSIECKTSLSSVCIFGTDYPVDACKSTTSKIFNRSYDDMQSLYR